MSQKFNTSTIVSKYIKYLLAYTPLPLYPTIEHNNYMLKDCLYIYKDRVLKCTKSGVFSSIPIEEYNRNLSTLTVNTKLTVLDEKEYPHFLSVYTAQQFDAMGNPMVEEVMLDGYSYKRLAFNRDSKGNLLYRYVQLPLCVTDDYYCLNNIVFAEYELVNSFNTNEFKSGVTQRYISTSNNYDADLHKHLGDYLRLIKNQYDVDLMSLYNCYANQTDNDVHISETYPFVKDNNVFNTKVLLIPIKFNKTYTIAMDCSSPILMKAIVYNHGLTTLPNGDIMCNYLSDKVVKINNPSFNKPFTFKLDNYDNEDKTIHNVVNTKEYSISSKTLQQFESNLYLAIQVPSNFKNTLVAIEGEYKSLESRIVSDFSIVNMRDNTKLFSSLVSSPSLLHKNDGEIHPFSDKLISYLLRNVIDNREIIDENIESVENKIGYFSDPMGQWDNGLRYTLYQKYLALNKNKRQSDYDILGYIDLDMEDAIRRGYIRNGN